MNNKYHPPHLSLHKLIASLSYWGTTTRMMLLVFLLLMLHILHAADGATFLQHFEQFIYIAGSFFLLDAGYVTIARAKPVRASQLDRSIFLMIVSVSAIIVLLPYIVVVQPAIYSTSRWLFLIVLFVLAFRLLVGMFYSTEDE